MPAGLTNIQTHTQTLHFIYNHTGGTITVVKEKTRDRIQYTTISHFNLIICSCREVNSAGIVTSTDEMPRTKSLACGSLLAAFTLH